MSVDFAAEALRLHVDQPWRKRAACIGRADVMDPPAEKVKAARDLGIERHLWEEAKQLCRSCPVLVQCRSWVVTLPAKRDPTGVCGGLTEEERGRERRRRAHLPAPPRTPPPVPDGHLPCTRCGEVKADTEFAADSRMVGRRGRRSHCRACVSAWQHEHRKAKGRT